MRARYVALSFAVLLVACSSSDGDGNDDAANETDDLVGGKQAADGDFPSTLLIEGNCTVSKVGPRHVLTAAHCVVDESGSRLREAFAKGAALEVSNAVVVEEGKTPTRTVRIAHVHIPGIYREEREAPGEVRVLMASAAPDVAIIELTEETAAALADIPAASIDLSPVEPGNRVVIMGYGCEEGTKASKDYRVQRLKTNVTTALPASALDHAGSYAKYRGEEYSKNLERQYLFTPGRASGEQEASLCPGDSGGPVYREGSRTSIVGVNAYYSFRPSRQDPSGISVTNWHTRLDTESRFDIGSWLASLGVSTTGGTPTTRYDRCAASPKTGRLLCGPLRAHVEANGGESAFGAPTTEARLERTSANEWMWTQRFEGKIARVRGGVIETEAAALDDACVGRLDGAWCGATLGDADRRALYRCSGDAVAERIVCEGDCISMPIGEPDQCGDANSVDPCESAELGDGNYCATFLGGSDRNALHRCEGGVTVQKIVCPDGCKEMPPGTPDQCAR